MLGRKVETVITENKNQELGRQALMLGRKVETVKQKTKIKN